MHSYLFAISLNSIPAVSLLFNTIENNGMRSYTPSAFPSLFQCVDVVHSGSASVNTSMRHVAVCFETSQIFGWIHKLASQNEIFLWEKFSIYHHILASLTYSPEFHSDVRHRPSLSLCLFDFCSRKCIELTGRWNAVYSMRRNKAKHRQNRQ